MKINTKTILFCLTLMVALVACNNKRQDTSSTPAKANRYSYEYVKQISLTQPKLALSILQTADAKGLMTPIDINTLRSMVYFNAMGDYTKAITYLEAALSDPDYGKQPDLQQSLLNMAALEYYSAGQYAKSLMFAEKGIDVAYKYDNRRLVAQIMTTMGQCHAVISNVGHAINCFDRAITILNGETPKTPTWDTYYDLVAAYALKANALLDMNRRDDLFKMQRSYETALQKINQLPEGINGANDVVNATYYSLYAIGYEQAGQHAQGHAMFDKLAATRAANTPEGATFVTPYLMLTKRYAEALQFVAKEEQAWRRSGKDSIDYNYTHNILMNKASALQELGRYKEAIETGMRAYVLADSLSRRIKGQNAIWISEQLGKKLLSKYIGQQDKTLAVSRTVNLVMGALLIICIVLMVYTIRYNLKIKQKNHAASTLISELLLYKRLLLDRLEPHQNKGDETSEGEREQDYLQYENFLKMEKLIIDRELFIQPKLERADVAREMGMTTNDFNALFNKFSDLPFNNYINDLRMERAAKLLKDKQNYTIEAIASECGVPVRQTFHRLFAKKFGMTPAEYRNS